MNIVNLLPEITPQATSWVEAESSRIAEVGRTLNERGLKMARAVGVQYPERIRIEFVEKLPLPGMQPLRDVVADLFTSEMDGVTFGHSIIIRDGRGNDKLFSHEFRHVFQYEQFGSIAAFIQEYMQQVAVYGYKDMPLEIDARKHELEWLGE